MMRRRPELNLVGLDLGGVKGQKKAYVWSQPYYCSRLRPWRPPVALESPSLSPPAVVKRGRPRIEREARVKVGRNVAGYEPTPEEIELAKAGLRARYPSERLKPG